jgi:hypothetical protein
MRGADNKFDLGHNYGRYAEELRDTQHAVLVDAVDAPTTLKDVNEEFRSTAMFARAIAQARHDDAMGHAGGPASSTHAPIPFAPVVHPANSNWVAPTAVFDDAAFPGHAYDVRLNVFNNDVGPGTVIGGRGLERAQGQGRSMGSGGGRGGTWDDMKEANKSTLENSINAARRSKETLARATRKVYLDALVQQAGGLDGITLDQSAAAAAEFEEKASRAEAIAKARRQMLDNVNFANGYERKRQQQQAAMPDAERALTKNYLDRLDPADGSWMHDHARKMRAQHMYDDRGQVEAHWATKCWEDNVVKALKTAGLTDNWGNFLILVIVVFTVSWYRLVSP